MFVLGLVLGLGLGLGLPSASVIGTLSRTSPRLTACVVRSPRPRSGVDSTSTATSPSPPAPSTHWHSAGRSASRVSSWPATRSKIETESWERAGACLEMRGGRRALSDGEAKKAHSIVDALYGRRHGHELPGFLSG